MVREPQQHAAKSTNITTTAITGHKSKVTAAVRMV